MAETTTSIGDKQAERSFACLTACDRHLNFHSRPRRIVTMRGCPGVRRSSRPEAT